MTNFKCSPTIGNGPWKNITMPRVSYVISGLFSLLLMSVILFNMPAFAAQNNPTENRSAGEPKILLELFTSQGCSSCPRADALLPTFIARKDVIALSLSIDYWDYLGWRDTFGKAIFSDRQRAYGRKFGEGMVYTPQMVVDGRHHMNGSDKKSIEQMIVQRKKDRTRNPGVSLDVITKDDMLMVSVGETPAGETAQKGTLWMALFSKEKTVKIRRGENRNRFLTYHNVVRELTPIGQWAGEGMTLKLPKNHIMKRGADGCVILLQQGDGGPIVAATQMPNW